MTCSVLGCNRTREARGYCHGHYERLRAGRPIGGPFHETDLDRFLAKVEVDGDCWIWVGATDGDGRYGAFYDSATGEVVRAHRWAYEHLTQLNIPQVIDHLCRRTRCVNPNHLEPVSQTTNIRRSGWGGGVNYRKTHCKRGHEFTPENTRPRGPDGRWRECIRCIQLRNARRSADSRELERAV